jgi:3-deoxy-D-manno-octulosonate 8-phosphate phosphatase (KDO 8-P phosphatase)
MSNNESLSINDIDAFVFDFDGVLTDNHLLLDKNGHEWVRCHRGDGLAFDVLRKLEIQTYIISTEKNLVVTARAEKLKVPVLQGISDKQHTLKELSVKDGLNLARTFYVGNDLNDFNAMQMCGYSACPADSHTRIKHIAKYILASYGGEGIVRELLETLFNLDFVEILYKTKR